MMYSYYKPTTLAQMAADISNELAALAKPGVMLSHEWDVAHDILLDIVNALFDNTGAEDGTNLLVKYGADPEVIFEYYS